MDARVTLNTSLKQTLFSVKYRTFQDQGRSLTISQCLNFDRFFFFFARLAKKFQTF